MRVILLCCLLLFALAGSAISAINVPSDGTDGTLTFSPNSGTQVIDLSQAVTGSWNQPGAGKGVYDPAKWAVVFKYASVSIPAGVTVKFTNHRSNAPVVWLVQGSVLIDGTVDLSGADGKGYEQGGHLAVPGPGGFRGGAGAIASGTPACSGFGPGGGVSTTQSYSSGPGNYGTPASTYSGAGSPYGCAKIVPLIGGAGGAGFVYPFDGGAGGGAMLIASADSVTINGAVKANGGRAYWSDSSGGSGSGGAIRIVADTVSGSGQLRASGAAQRHADSGPGRIRVEASVPFAGTCAPAASFALPDNPVVIWPEDSASPVPSVKVVAVDSVPSPDDPHSSFAFPGHDVSISNDQPVSIVLEAKNVPVSPTPWNVIVRIAPRYGQVTTVSATFVSGTNSVSTWQATATLPVGYCAIQARASKP